VIRVLLADDHAVVRSGLAQLLGRVHDIEVAATAADGEEAVSLARVHGPDVILMDLAMPRMDGVEATRLLQVAQPHIRVVILTSFADRKRIFDALDAGAVGYLLKDSEPGDLVRAIRAAARGEAPLHPRAAEAVLTERRAGRRSSRLSPREVDVLRLVADGASNKLVARELGVSEKTVKSHMTRIFDALGVTNRTAAAIRAREQGLVQHPAGPWSPGA
jgi:DNA-binding NarL/FixJ family response regulator